MDAQYVSASGVVRSAGIRPDVSNAQKFWLKIAMAGGSVNVILPANSVPSANGLIDATVRVDAAVTCTKNQNGQIMEPLLLATGTNSITLLRRPPHDPFDLPLTPAGRLMQYRSGTDYDQRVRVAGTVTYYDPGQTLVMEDEGHALLVRTDQISDITPGNRIEVSGFLEPGLSAPILQDALFRYVAHGQQVQPTSVKISDLSSGVVNHNLIIIEGRLLREINEPQREVLVIQDQSTLLLAELANPKGPHALQQLQEGSIIRVSGISMLDVEGPWNVGGPSATAVRCKVLLRSADDVQVITPPSWWTTLHVIYIAAILAILTLACLVLIAFSRREHWRLQAVLEERERLAYEIHDTLAQSFAGIGFQLQAIRRSIPSNLAALREQVDLAQALVRHSHKEARRSIGSLDSELPEGSNLLTSLEATARTMVEAGSVEVTTISDGVPRPLPRKIAGNLLRIGQEAVANAVRHAEPSHLKIAVAYEINTVALTVKDDGIGFTESGDLLGFGLRGMRKRAAAIAAKLEILSQPGGGTSIKVVAPLPSSPALSASFKRIWKYLPECVSHARNKQNPHPNSDC
jgi:signal transduction histidine kinase